MRAVNLLPRDEARSGRGLPSPWVLLAATVPVIAGSLVYLGYSTEHAKVADRSAELAAVQAQVDKFASKQAGVRAQGELVGLRGKRQAALEDALGKSFAWNVTLDEIARVLPKGIALTNLNAQSPTPASASAAAASAAAAAASIAAAAPTSFTILGTAGSHDQIAELLERLSLLPMLTNVNLNNTTTLISSSPTAKKGPPQIQFAIAAGVVVPAEGAGR